MPSWSALERQRMQADPSATQPGWSRRISTALSIYALVGGAVSFSGWALSIPRFKDWSGGGITIKPNAALAVVVSAIGALVLSRRPKSTRALRVLGGFVAIVGGLTFFQHVTGLNLGIDTLLFEEPPNAPGTASPNRMGPPASFSLLLLGIALVFAGARRGSLSLRAVAPLLAVSVCALMMLSFTGYLFNANKFYAIPWLSGIAFQTSTMLMALGLAIIVAMREYDPMRLLMSESGAGLLARRMLPLLVVLPLLLGWIRTRGQALGWFDEGTGRSLLVLSITFLSVAMLWLTLRSLERQEWSIREGERRKDEFLATLAHELRNPLAPIRNAVSILDIASSDRATIERTVGIIGRQVTQLVRLIDDLLDLSRISRGRLELRKERIELGPLIQQAVETCRPLADASGHAVFVHLPPDGTYVEADPVRLAQVVSNLLNNACKFTNHGGRISLSCGRQGSDAVLSVKDNGVGIPRDKLDDIFEMFSQIDGSLERSQGGLGIGLAIVKRLVELHGGSIQARSEGPGQGSEFIVQLPGVIELPQALASDATGDIDAVRGRRILVVDDNKDGAETLAVLLRLAGAEIRVAYDGEEAVNAATKFQPDIVLLDIGLPKLNGYEACRRIRKHPAISEIVIVALTGWGQEEDRRKSTAAGFDGHLVKPVDQLALGELLASRLNERGRH
jgi:signal transduction histidine kinase/CheY-like chemotaxis protein